MMELGLFDTDLGATVIAAGVIDDIVSFVALGMIQQIAGSGSGAVDGALVEEVGKILLFLGAYALCEYFARRNGASLRRWTERFESHLKTSWSFFALLLVSTIGISLLAEWAGLQLVIGAFFAGLLVSEIAGPAKLAEANSVVRGATFVFFGPIAFSFIGIEFVLNSVLGMPDLVFSLLAVALMTKFAGGYFGARISRFKPGESSVIGFLMNSRGFVELVIATTAYQLGMIDQGLFSVVICVGILTTIISPIATRNALKGTDRAKLAPHSVAPLLTKSGG